MSLGASLGALGDRDGGASSSTRPNVPHASSSAASTQAYNHNYKLTLRSGTMVRRLRPLSKDFNCSIVGELVMFFLRFFMPWPRLVANCFNFAHLELDCFSKNPLGTGLVFEKTLGTGLVFQKCV